MTTDPANPDDGGGVPPPPPALPPGPERDRLDALDVAAAIADFELETAAARYDDERA